MLQMTKLRPGLENHLPSLKQQVWRTTGAPLPPGGTMPPFFLKFLLVWTLLCLWALLAISIMEALGLREAMWPYVVPSYSWPTNFAGSFAKGTERKEEEGQLGFILGEGIIWTRQRDPVRRPLWGLETLCFGSFVFLGAWPRAEYLFWPEAPGPG